MTAVEQALAAEPHTIVAAVRAMDEQILARRLGAAEADRDRERRAVMVALLPPGLRHALG